MKNNLVSVIITTKNEGNNIENCLKSIISQTYKDIEIIVVDNISTDKTKEIAKKYTGLVYDKGPERSAQRNFGVSVSSGEYILYLDADMILAPFVVESCINEITTGDKVIGLYIKEVILGKSLWSKVRRFERSFYCGTPIDVVRFVQKEAFLKVKGFDESLSGPEDWDFNRKMSKVGKLKLIENQVDLDSSVKTCSFSLEIERLLLSNGIVREDIYDKYNNSIFHNESSFNLLKYLKKKSYYMKDFDKYIQKWGSNDPLIKKQFGISYRYFGVFIENGKWKKLALHPILTFKMFILRFMVGITFLKTNILML